MAFCHPLTPKNMTKTALLFLTGLTMFVVGAHYSYVHVERQQARTKARSDLLREHLLKKYGYNKKWGNLDK
ncbi:hypothetical protein MRB53_014256 [Persea americana]|uniref:Uncharacterized protein n=1 Tax=Persea americana TaxID=3435 RepID=A0ACC2KA93_PERAE|nr:hypothetical protein MRB53_014256 [Persea americana]